MKPPFSYLITHIQLTDAAIAPLAASSQAGRYVVLWWKQIPVGQLFVEPGESLTSAQLEQHIQAHLRPFIESHCPPESAPSLADEAAATDTRSVPIRGQLDAALRSFDTASVPARVPISVVICTRNRAAQLRDALRSLRSLPCRPDEIIVVDNASADDSTAQVVAQFADVVYQYEPRPGLDIARNTGVGLARMPIVAFIDDDVRVHPHWAFRVWQTFEQTDVAAMTGLVIAAELQTEAQLIFEKHWSFNRGYLDKVYDTAYFTRHLPAGPPVWEIGAGANMAFRRSVFERVGLFDERLDVGAAGCNGDSELWFRLLTHGYTIQYNPRAVAYHEHRRDMGALKKQLFSYMRGHTVAALLQQQQYREANYRKYVFRGLPQYYLLLLRTGFPAFRFRHQTLAVEINGIVSGLVYYFRNRTISPTVVNRQRHATQKPD